MLRNVDRVNLRDPPIVVARSRSARRHERLVIRRPIVVVNVEILRRNLAQLASGNVENSNALIVNGGVDYAGSFGRGH